MSNDLLLIARDARGVATMTMNRPEKRNALSAELIDALTKMAYDLAHDPTVRVVVLRGAGTYFCGGGDLDWMRAQMAADRPARVMAARSLAQMLGVLNNFPKPLIAAIHGGAFGGGVGLASVCDLAIAADDAKFGLTETRLGLIAATIGPYVVARMGTASARQVMLSGAIFDAVRAVQLGIISASFPPSMFDAAIESAIAPFLDAAPAALAATKAMIRDLGAPIDDASIEASINRLADIWEGDEAREGIAAFFAKTPPPWRDQN